MALTAVSGDGSISPLNTMASLVIRQNDDPISFNSSFVEASEGDAVLFTIARGGQANGTCIKLTLSSEGGGGQCSLATCAFNVFHLIAHCHTMYTVGFVHSI